jgi:hypothetical protein
MALIADPWEREIDVVEMQPDTVHIPFQQDSTTVTVTEVPWGWIAGGVALVGAGAYALGRAHNK